MTKDDVKTQIILLQSRANGCLGDLSKWKSSSNLDKEIVIPALKARYAVLCAEVDGLRHLIENWDELAKS